MFRKVQGANDNPPHTVRHIVLKMQLPVNISALPLFSLKIQSSNVTGCTRVKLILREVAQTHVAYIKGISQILHVCRIFKIFYGQPT